MAAAVGGGTRSRAEDAQRERQVDPKECADTGSLSLKLLALPGGQLAEHFHPQLACLWRLAPWCAPLPYSGDNAIDEQHW